MIQTMFKECFGELLALLKKSKLGNQGHFCAPPLVKTHFCPLDENTDKGFVADTITAAVNDEAVTVVTLTEETGHNEGLALQPLNKEAFKQGEST